MAVGMLLAGEGFTQESYRAVTEAMFGNYPMREEQAPEGLIVHTAGQGDEGWYVYDLWRSREDFQRFVAEKLTPAMEAMGAGGEAGPAPAPVFFAVETFVTGPALA